MQTDASVILQLPCQHCWPNNAGRCCVLLHEAKSLTAFQSNSQKRTTTCNKVSKRAQHVTSKNAGSCWPTMLRPFVRGLIFLSPLSFKENGFRYQVSITVRSCVLSQNMALSNHLVTFDTYWVYVRYKKGLRWPQLWIESQSQEILQSAWN